jgi:hypothetical protein
MHRTAPNSRHITDIMFRGNKAGALVLVAAFLASALPATAQSSDAQDKAAALKQAVAANQQKLRQYQWTETTQLNLNGEDKPPSQSSCQYGPDGKVIKTPMSPPPPPPSGGRFKQRIVQKKTGEMQDYMGQVKTLLALYVPPDPNQIQQAIQAGKVSVNPSPGTGTTNIVFTNYALPGDKMTVTFNSEAHKISALNVNTYLDNPKEVVTLTVSFSSLADGTNFVQQTILNATAKKLIVTTTSTNYQPLGQ